MMLDYYKEKIKKAKLNLKLVEIGISREIEGYSDLSIKPVTLEHYGLRNFLEEMADCYELVGELDSEISRLEEKIIEEEKGDMKNEGEVI